MNSFAPTTRRRVQTWRRERSNAGQGSQHDELAVEVPVALAYNGVAHAVMIATPTDLEAFAMGFSLTEGLIDAPDEVYDISVRGSDRGVEVELRIAARRFQRLNARRRQMTGRTGCGLCGAESLAQLDRPVVPVRPTRIDHQSIECAIDQLDAHQPLQQQTGAVHGAAWCTPEGSLEYLFEDVGRHNALDKLIGARLINGETGDGFGVVSSRASYEMAQKAAVAGFGLLVCVSAATDRAVDTARRYGMALVGFARPGRHVVYHDPMASMT